MIRPGNTFNIGALVKEIRPLYQGSDPAHDFSHIMRVYQNAMLIGEREKADMNVLVLAALLHDAGSGSKKERGNDSGQNSLRIAEDFLIARDIPEDVRQKAMYAIKVHSFRKGIVPVTLEAKILQDADRLDAMGAIGIARVFLTGGSLGRPLYNPDDPFCRNREPDDGEWNLDHFYRKLLKLESGMNTETARRLARKRGIVMKRYLLDLQEEIEGLELGW
jgi:uncharacterized protein